MVFWVLTSTLHRTVMGFQPRARENCQSWINRATTRSKESYSLTPGCKLQATASCSFPQDAILPLKNLTEKAEAII